MEGQLTITANDENGITVTGFLKLDTDSFCEKRTIKDLIEYLLSYEPKTKTEDKEDKENG